MMITDDYCMDTQKLLAQAIKEGEQTYGAPDTSSIPKYVIRNDSTVALESIAESLKSIDKSLQIIALKIGYD